LETFVKVALATSRWTYYIESDELYLYLTVIPLALCSIYIVP